MLELELEGRNNADLILTGRFAAQDVKVWALPVSE
jgi:hypothetical protein